MVEVLLGDRIKKKKKRVSKKEGIKGLVVLIFVGNNARTDTEESSHH
jgi:hypothetical protein